MGCIHSSFPSYSVVTFHFHLHWNFSYGIKWSQTIHNPTKFPLSLSLGNNFYQIAYYTYKWFAPLILDTLNSWQKYSSFWWLFIPFFCSVIIALPCFRQLWLVLATFVHAKTGQLLPNRNVWLSLKRFNASMQSSNKLRRKPGKS